MLGGASRQYCRDQGPGARDQGPRKRGEMVAGWRPRHY